MKRFFDILFSSMILITLLPLLILIAIAIKLTSKGPILYRSRRVREEGKLFDCFKFRTMYIDADERLKNILKLNRKMRAEWKQFCKLQDDPRVTPLGKFLRKTSLDELLQFFNVLKGDLSVVGPRPYLQKELERWTPRSQKILTIKPGITGLWQTSGRSALPFSDRLRLDEAYIENRSFLGDLILIAKTIPAVLFARGAH